MKYDVSKIENETCGTFWQLYSLLEDLCHLQTGIYVKLISGPIQDIDDPLLIRIHNLYTQKPE